MVKFRNNKTKRKFNCNRNLFLLDIYFLKPPVMLVKLIFEKEKLLYAANPFPIL